MPDIKDIDDVLSITQDLETKAQPRIGQFKGDEALWRLERYILEEIATRAPHRAQDFPTFTSNEPRNQADAYIGLLTRYPIRPRGDVIGLEGEGEEDELSVHERFLIGVQRLLDSERGRRGEMPLQDDMAWHHCLRGGSVVRVWVSREDKENPFSVALWDPAEVVWLMARRGPAFVCRHYLAPKYDVEEAWDTEVEADTQGNTEVWDAWWQCEKGDIWNSVIGRGKVILKDLTNHTKDRKLDHVPVLITRSLGSPSQPKPTGEGTETWQTDQWESIFAGNRHMFAQYNRIATLYSLLIRQAAIGPYKAKGRDLPQNLEQAIAPFKVLDLGPDGDINPVAPPQMAREAKEFWGAVQGHIQRGGIPFSVFGQLPFELSGVAVSQLQGALEIRTKRLARSLETAYEAWSEEIIGQFLQLRRKVRLSGLDRRRRPFLEDFTASQLRTKYHLGWELRTDLPVVRMQEATIAESWQRLGVPLLYVFDELLHLQDPNWAYRRKVMEEADQDPLLGAIRRAEAFLSPEVNRPDLAQIVLQSIPALLGRGTSQPGGMPPLPRPQVASAEMMGRPTGEFVPGPQHLPAEVREEGA